MGNGEGGRVQNPEVNLALLREVRISYHRRRESLRKHRVDVIATQAACYIKGSWKRSQVAAETASPRDKSRLERQPWHSMAGEQAHHRAA